MTQLIDYVDATGRLWGAARRRLDLKLEKWPNSVAGRVADAMPTSHEQRYPELFVGEVLRFNMAVHKLPERQRRICYVHYVVPLPTAKKIRILHVSRAKYFEILVNSHRNIANTLEYS